MVSTYKLTQEEQELHDANIQKLKEIAESGMFSRNEIVQIIEDLKNKTVIKVEQDNDYGLQIQWKNALNGQFGGIGITYKTNHSSQPTPCNPSQIL